MGTTTQRLIKGSGANALQLIAKVLEQLLLVPILLSAWSVQLYGEWMLLSTVPIYLSLSDMGFITAGSNELARRSGNESWDRVQQFFTDYVSTYLGWSLLLVTLFMLGAILAPLDSWLGLHVISRNEANTIFCVLIATTLLSQNSLSLLGGLRACRLFHVGLLLRAISAFLRLSCIFIVVYFLDAGPVEAAVVMLIVRVVEYMVQAKVLNQHGLYPGWRPFRRTAESMKPYLLIGLEFMLMPIAQAIVLQGMVMMVGLTLGAVAVAVFTAHRTLSRLTSQVLQLAVAPLRAEAGLLQGEAHQAELVRILRSVSSITLWLSLVTGALLMIVGPTLFYYWTGNKIPFLQELFLFLIISTVLEGGWRVMSTIRLSSNRQRPLALGYMVLSLLGLGLAYALGSVYGLATVALPLVFIDLCMCILTVHVTLPLIGMGYSTYLLGLARPPVREARAIVRRICSKEPR